MPVPFILKSFSHSVTVSISWRDFERPDVPAYSCSAHKEIINCIDGVGGLSSGCGAPEIVTGSRDGQYSGVCEFFSVNSVTAISSWHLYFAGSVKVWDPRQNDKPVAVMEPEESDIRRDCWAVGFGKFVSSSSCLMQHMCSGTGSVVWNDNAAGSSLISRKLI